MKRINIFDIDGVIACTLHRFRVVNGKLDLKHWQENRHLAFRDSLLPESENYRLSCNNTNNYTIIATARDMHPAEWEWFQRNLPMPDHFIFRKPGDTRPSAEQKLSGLRKILSLKQFRDIPKYYYEDTPAVLHYISAELGLNPVLIPSKQGIWV